MRAMRHRSVADRAQSACPGLPGLALDRMSPALDRQLSTCDRGHARGAYRQRLEFSPTCVLEDDWLLAGVDVLVAPLLQRKNDRTQIGAGLGQVVLVARWALGVDPALEHADLLEPAQARGEH